MDLWSVFTIFYVGPVHNLKRMGILDRLCGLVVRVPGCKPRGPGCDSRRYQILCISVGLKRGPVSLLRINEELLG
jgi:hypothetical protein